MNYIKIGERRKFKMPLIELIQANPRISIIVISFIATSFITIVRYFMTDRAKMREMRERQKKLREEMKKFREDPEKIMELNKKMLEDFPEQMRAGFKPMIITLIPLLILFKWLLDIYSTTAIEGSWIWWYIISSVVFGILLSKIFGLQ